MSQVQYDFEFGSLIFLLKKHFCPNCISQKLKVSYTVSEVVESDKTNVNEFKMGRYYFSGDKVVKKPCFYCEKCHSKFSVEDIKVLEKNKRGNTRK